MASFTGKVVLITGSAGGLGKALAVAFLEAGARVVLCDINETRLSEAEKELSSKGEVLAHKVDTTSEESVVALIKAAVDKFGKLDVLVNNAGIMDAFAPAGDIEKTQWDSVIAVNLTGTFLVTKHFINHVLPQASSSPASIVNIGSVASFAGWSAGTAYTTSKHALVGFTKSTAAFYRTKNVRCNLVEPPGMATNIFPSKLPFHEEGSTLMRELHPKIVHPDFIAPLEDVAKLVLYLSSEQASLINGQCISPDRGMVSAS